MTGQDALESLSRSFAEKIQHKTEFRDETTCLIAGSNQARCLIAKFSLMLNLFRERSAQRLECVLAGHVSRGESLAAQPSRNNDLQFAPTVWRAPFPALGRTTNNGTRF